LAVRFHARRREGALASNPAPEKGGEPPPEIEARAAFGMEQSAALAPDWNQFTIGAFDVANLMVA
jgi:hypothetical protein